MSANFLEKDTIHSTSLSWHKQDVLKENIDYESSGLDWTVEREELMLKRLGKDIVSHVSIYCPEKDHSIEVAKKSYQIIQNRQLFDLIEEGLTGISYKILNAGSLGNLRKVFVSVALEENQDYLINGDQFKNYLSFVTSHDGSLNLEIYDSMIRVVCANTLQWSRNEKGILDMSVRHTKNCQVKIDSMKDKIEQLFEKRKEFYTTYEGMMARPMTSEQAQKILIGFEAKDILSTQVENKVEQIVGLFNGGLGNDGKTLADLFNGVTQYYTRELSQSPAKAWASSEFGLGRDRKLAFWNAITDDKLDKLADRGERLLSLV